MKPGESWEWGSPPDPLVQLTTKDVPQSRVGSSSSSKGVNPRGLTHGKASQMGIRSWESLLGKMGSTAGTTPTPWP